MKTQFSRHSPHCTAMFSGGKFGLILK